MKKPSNRAQAVPSQCPLTENEASGAVLAPFSGDICFALALLIAMLAAYHPAWHGGILWDDDIYFTKPELRSVVGLWRIWFEPGVTPQFYPLTHSVFWIQHQLWGENTLGYHLVNIVLHTVSAVLFMLILRRLEVPGAYLAAVIFALHPVHVESVAWMTELKNTLSGVLYLGSALAYLHFDSRRSTALYVTALVLFVLALLSKTSTVTLPAALLVVFWWQRGRLNWQNDVRPLVPFFIFGIAAGLFTVLVERVLVGAAGSSYDSTFIERCLIAGRVIWFYLGQLIWPADLIFIYPRWEISQGIWWQYLSPLGVIGLLVGLWLLRDQTRAPLAALLLFCGTLFPVLGFFNVYFFVYSFVADHFQYLASLSVISLFAAGVMSLVARFRLGAGPAPIAIGLLLAGVLGTLTWRQSRQYVNIETLYQETISRNPGCWLCHNNLGDIAHKRGQFQQAVAHYEDVLRYNPKYAEAHYNLGLNHKCLGNIQESVVQYEKALLIKPNLWMAQFNLGNVLLELGDFDKAAAQFLNVVRIVPDHAPAYNHCGFALESVGRIDEAVACYQQALIIVPDSPEVQFNVGRTLVKQGRPRLAAEHLEEALRLQPDFPAARDLLIQVKGAKEYAPKSVP